MQAGTPPAPPSWQEIFKAGTWTHLKHAVSRQAAAAEQGGVERLLVGHGDQRGAEVAAGAAVGGLQRDLIAPDRLYEPAQRESYSIS